MSQLMFWNKQHNSNSSNNNNKESNNKDQTNDKNGKRNWLHTPDSLINGHIVYLVKFFGKLPVEQPKGIEVVKDAIRKLQFSQQMRKAEIGVQEKFKKVEITISVDGVAVQEPRTQKILHQFPLHDISYCADEKGVKKFFSFIAKTVKTSEDTTNGLNESVYGDSLSRESHECFIFISNKLASDITLTIGQAFDLAYRKYISNAEKSDLSKAQQHIAELQKALAMYKHRLLDISAKLPKSELDAFLFKYGINDVLEVPIDSSAIQVLSNENENKLCEAKSTYSTKSSISSSSCAPIVPPRNNIPNQIIHKTSSYTQKMEEMLLNSDSDSDFDPRADESVDSSGSGKNNNNDLFGFEPPKSFGQQLFFNNDNKHQSNDFTNNNCVNNGPNELISTPPLLAPPPKVAAPRRITTVNNNTSISNNMSRNNDLLKVVNDVFQSDPFDIDGAHVKNKPNDASVPDFSLESLDPLKM